MSSGSDTEDERELPDQKKPRLHFGSLEEAERQRKEDGGASKAVLAGIQAGNINITKSMQLAIEEAANFAPSRCCVINLAPCIVAAIEPVAQFDPTKIADPVKEGMLAEFERRRKVCSELILQRRYFLVKLAIFISTKCAQSMCSATNEPK
jgi:hypothetical protein